MNSIKTKKTWKVEYRQPVEGKKYLTSEEMCHYLGISYKQLLYMTSTKAIPHFRPRYKLLLFDWEEVEKWIREKPVEAKRRKFKHPKDPNTYR